MGWRGRRQKIKSGDEFDWLYGRRWYHWRPGVGKAIKRALAKRRRKEGKREDNPGAEYEQ